MKMSVKNKLSIVAFMLAFGAINSLVAMERHDDSGISAINLKKTFEAVEVIKDRTKSTEEKKTIIRELIKQGAQLYNFGANLRIPILVQTLSDSEPDLEFIKFLVEECDVDINQVTPNSPRTPISKAFLELESCNDNHKREFHAIIIYFLTHPKFHPREGKLLFLASRFYNCMDTTILELLAKKMDNNYLEIF